MPNMQSHPFQDSVESMEWHDTTVWSVDPAPGFLPSHATAALIHQTNSPFAALAHIQGMGAAVWISWGTAAIAPTAPQIARRGRPLPGPVATADLLRKAGRANTFLASTESTSAGETGEDPDYGF